jgi:hypothetical protein
MWVPNLTAFISRLQSRTYTGTINNAMLCPCMKEYYSKKVYCFDENQIVNEQGFWKIFSS